VKGCTKQYYSLFLKAKTDYSKDDLRIELSSDPSNYENIYSRIREVLQDNDGIGIDSLHTRLQLKIEEKLNPKLSVKINESLSIFGIIRDAVQGKVFNYDQDKPWIKAVQYALLYQDNNQKGVDHSYVPEEYHHIARSILRLKDLGFKIQSIDGLIKADDPELLRLSSAIDYRASRLGWDGLLNMNQLLGDKFSFKDMRFYLFRRRSTLPSPQAPSPPYGYLFNLFCKYVGKKATANKWQITKKFNDIKELSTHLSTILDIDKMSPYSNISVSHENILEKIREWVLYPEVFYIPQISPNHGKVLFPRLFDLLDGLPAECKVEMTLTADILQKIESVLLQHKSISGRFTEQEIFKLCIDFASQDEVSTVLSKISVSSNLINKDYKTPFDAHKANIKEIPLIKIGKEYVVANIAAYNIAVYRTLSDIPARSIGIRKTDIKLGVALESFVKERLEKSNIQFHHSFKYFVPDSIKREIDTKRHEGECDFIIEAEDYIFLVEVKKKGLTKESWSGDIISLMTDTTLSFIKSINQLSIAELILLIENKIQSKSGVEVFLKERDIFKLAISFEDMASLQSDSIKNSLLSGLYNININAENYEHAILEKINKSLNEFTKIHNSLSEKKEKYKQNPFHDVFYVSTPQLLTMLEDCGSNEDLRGNIIRSNSIVFSLMDWHASYAMAKKNKLIETNEEVFKRSTMIN